MSEDNAKDPSRLPGGHAAGDAPPTGGRSTPNPLSEADAKLVAVNSAFLEATNGRVKEFESQSLQFALEVDKSLHGRTDLLGELVRFEVKNPRATEQDLTKKLLEIMREQGFPDEANQYVKSRLGTDISTFKVSVRHSPERTLQAESVAEVFADKSMAGKGPDRVALRISEVLYDKVSETNNLAAHSNFYADYLTLRMSPTGKAYPDEAAARLLEAYMEKHGFPDSALALVRQMVPTGKVPEHVVIPPTPKGHAATAVADAEASALKTSSGGFSSGPHPTTISSDIGAEPHHAGGRLGKAGVALAAGAALYVLGTAVADASEGHKLEVLGEEALRLVPGVTGVEKLSNTDDPHRGMNAALDFGGLIVPFAGEIARKPDVQAVIDAMPKDPRQLAQQMCSSTTPPIDRHLAEVQLRYIDARVNHDVVAGLSTSSRLTNLAEQRLELQAQWQKNAGIFETAVNNPNTDWPALARVNPDLAVPVARHIAAVNDPLTLLEKDAAIIKDIASGTPPEQTTQQQTCPDQGLQR